MEKNPKKSIDSLKDQQIDGKDVKGGFTFVSMENNIGCYHVTNSNYGRANAIADAKLQGFKHARITNKESGESTTITIN